MVTSFSLELSQNKYLSTSDDHMHAVLTVRMNGVAAGAVVPAAEVLLVDCSSSMDWPPTKIDNARRAAAAAIDLLREGTLFAIVAGTEQATMKYPETEELRPVNAENRARAKAVAANLIANGGTAMSTWLTTAKRLLERYPKAIRHTLLLTDGVNQSEPSARLHQALDACRGRFTCDARGIGDDWAPEELLRIASTLQGTADAVVEDDELAADFRRIIRSSMDKFVRDLKLRIVTPAFSRVEFVRQVAPTELELTGQDVPGRGLEVPTGPWGEESREYLVCLRLEDLAGRPRFENLQLGRVELVIEGDGPEVPEAPLPILGHITNDVTLSTRIDDKVQRHTVHTRLGEKLREGWAHFGEQDLDGAARAWGVAVRLATELGNEEILRRLGRLVDTEDAGRGIVRVKNSVRPRDGFSLILGSTINPTSPPHGPAAMDRGAEAGDQPRECPVCHSLSPPGAKVCMGNGHPLDPGPEGGS